MCSSFPIPMDIFVTKNHALCKTPLSCRSKNKETNACEQQPEEHSISINSSADEWKPLLTSGAFTFIMEKGRLCGYKQILSCLHLQHNQVLKSPVLTFQVLSSLKTPPNYFLSLLSFLEEKCSRKKPKGLNYSKPYPVTLPGRGEKATLLNGI